MCPGKFLLKSSSVGPLLLMVPPSVVCSKHACILLLAWFLFSLIRHGSWVEIESVDVLYTSKLSPSDIGYSPLLY